MLAVSPVTATMAPGPRPVPLGTAVEQVCHTLYYRLLIFSVSSFKCDVKFLTPLTSNLWDSAKGRCSQPGEAAESMTTIAEYFFVVNGDTEALIH